MDRRFSADTHSRTETPALYSVGVYIRLSVEDATYDSDSVEHQHEMLSKFVELMPGWMIHRFYIDNGFSGGTFDRPAFQELMQDVRSGAVTLLLVKDLSRFGRNYLEAGRYLEEELPALGCRFVALEDGVDTDSGENDIVPFLNAMNDFYLKNLSDRIKSVLHAKARDGQKICGPQPYGFLRDPVNRTRLIIDDYAAGVVRRIFQMRSQGAGYFTIVKTLNSEGILPPKLYYRVANNMDTSKLKHKKWIDCTVNSMLRNEIYIGTAVQLKQKMVSYRDRREVHRPEDEWVRVENAFPAIIDRETWDAVQEVNRKASQMFPNRRAPQKSLFHGLLSCPDCGAAMILTQSMCTDKNGGKTARIYYICRTYSATAGTSCTRHSISEQALKAVILDHILQLAKRIELDEEAMLRSLMQRLVGCKSASKAAAEKERHSLRQRIQKLEAATAKLYEDRVAGFVSEKAFLERMQKHESERLEKQKRLALLEQSEEESAAKLADIQHWIRLIREHASQEDVNREMLEALVEKIEVGESVVADGVKQQDIHVVYRFVSSVGGDING